MPEGDIVGEKAYRLSGTTLRYEDVKDGADLLFVMK